MLYFCEYCSNDSGIPVNASIGLSSMDAARHRGKLVCRVNGYCGFWILRKPPIAGLDPTKVEYHSCSVDPRGNIRWYPAVKLD